MIKDRTKVVRSQQNQEDETFLNSKSKSPSSKQLQQQQEQQVQQQQRAGIVSERVEMYENTGLSPKAGRQQRPSSLAKENSHGTSNRGAGGSSSRRTSSSPSSSKGQQQQHNNSKNNTSAVTESRDECPGPASTGSRGSGSASTKGSTASAAAAAAADRANHHHDSNYVGATLIEEGVHHYSCSDFDASIKSFNTALKLQRVTVGDNHICIALTLGNLGAAYLQLGEIDLAERVLNEALKIKKRLYPVMNQADTLNNLGNCANLRGDYARSLQYYKQALQDLTAKGGTPQAIANTNFNIGRLEIQMKNWEEAKRVLAEACKVTKEIYGPNHDFVAQTLDLIGFAQLSTEEYDSAMVSFTRALGVFRQLHGPLHLTVANSLFNVGMVREAKGQFADAWEAYSTTKDLYVRLGTDVNHVGYQTVLDSITKIEALVGKEKKQQQQQQQQKSSSSAFENNNRMAAAAAAAAANNTGSALQNRQSTKNSSSQRRVSSKQQG